MSSERKIIPVDVTDGAHAVILVTRGDPQTFWDSYQGNGRGFPPIERAVWVARLRALADQIEAAPPYTFDDAPDWE